MSTVISVEEVSKMYRLGEIGTGSLAHDVNRWWHKVRGREDPYLKVGQSNDRSSKADSDYVYAINNVSFDVKQGEVLGIIGRNGAGKSTLLKILSRVTTPTMGEIRVKGRIASLLEVGTGFHPELTGRENIYLNGAILGMRKVEIRNKFEEIVEFSGCERYIDTPVKRYSSGMYVRLAFAVAAHLEPEILIVDEVLAVGDAEFQKKCMGKMKDVAGEGRTVLFVSHNLSAIKVLCSRALFFSDGKLVAEGPTEQVLSTYVNDKTSSTFVSDASISDRPHIVRIGFSDNVGSERDNFTRGEEITVNANISNPNNEALNLELAFFDSSGIKIWNFTHDAYGLDDIVGAPYARITITFSVPALCLDEIFVHVGLRACSNPEYDYIHHITEGLSFTISPPPTDTYRQPGTLVFCPVKFNTSSYEPNN